VRSQISEDVSVSSRYLAAIDQGTTSRGASFSTRPVMSSPFDQREA